MREVFKSIAAIALGLTQIVIYVAVFFFFIGCVIFIAVMTFGATFDRASIAYYQEHYWPSVAAYVAANLGAMLTLQLKWYLQKRWQHLDL